MRRYFSQDLRNHGDPFRHRSDSPRFDCIQRLDPTSSRVNHACEFCGVAGSRFEESTSQLAGGCVPIARDEDESTMFDAHVSPARDRSDNGRVADFAEPVFRRLRLFSQGAQVSHVSRSVEGAFDHLTNPCRSSEEETDSIDGREESVEGDDAMVHIPSEDPVEMDFPRTGAIREGLD